MSEVPERSLLVATDFSPESAIALAWGAHFAEARGAVLWLVHALHWPHLAGVSEMAAVMAEELRVGTRRRLEQLAAPLRMRLHDVRCELEVGAPTEVVLRVAARCRPDLVVVGARGLHGWRDLLLGSTAQRLIAGADCPVLVLHGGDGEPPTGPWRALAATDFSGDATAAVQAAARLLAPRLGDVVLVHVFAPELTFDPAEMTATVQQFVAAGERQVEVALAAEAAKLRAEGIPVRAELRCGVPAPMLVAAAKEADVDLLVVGTRGRGATARALLGSTAERVAQHAGCAVLVVPRRAHAGTA